MKFFCENLAEKLTKWKRYYSNNTCSYFDWRHIDVFVFQGASGKWSVSAITRCDDIDSPLGYVEPILCEARIFLRDNKFRTRISADAHVEEQILFASKIHPNTAFYRDRIVSVLTDGVWNNDVLLGECCLNGAWIHVDYDEKTGRRIRVKLN
jgi:hypothetical protein